MEHFPGTKEAWYRTLKEKINQIMEQIEANKLQIPDNLKNVTMPKLHMVLDFILDILRVERKAVIEDILYSPKAIGKLKIKDKNELNKILRYIELILQSPIEDFRLYEDIPTPIYGNAIMEYYSPLVKNKTNYTLNEGGTIKFVDVLKNKSNFVNIKSDKVIVTQLEIERLIEQRVPEKLNAIIVGLGDPVPRSTRNISRKLSINASLPIYILTEGTPQGLMNAMSIITGPMENTPEFMQKFIVPHALWVGYSINDALDDIQPKMLTQQDKEILKKLKNKRLSRTDPFKKEIKSIIEKNLKIPLEEVEKIDVVSYLSSKIP